MKMYDLDFETNITVVTAEEYVQEIEYGADEQFTKELLLHTWGQEYTHFVRAVISGGDYAWRLFAPIRGDHRNCIKNAISEVMNELLDDYADTKYNKLMQERNKK